MTLVTPTQAGQQIPNLQSKVTLPNLKADKVIHIFQAKRSGQNSMNHNVKQENLVIMNFAHSSNADPVTRCCLDQALPLPNTLT